MKNRAERAREREGREAKQVKEIKLGQMSDAVEVGLESCLVWLVVKDPFTATLLLFDPTNGPSSCQKHLTEEYKMLDVHQHVTRPSLWSLFSDAVLISVKEWILRGSFITSWCFVFLKTYEAIAIRHQELFLPSVRCR